MSRLNGSDMQAKQGQSVKMNKAASCVEDGVRHNILAKLASKIHDEDPQKIYAQLLKKCDVQAYQTIFKDYMKYEKAQYFAKEVYVEMTKAIRKSSIQPTKKDQVIKKLRSNIDEEEDPEKIYSLLFDSQSEAKFLEILCEYMGKKQAEPLAKELHLQMTTGQSNPDDGGTPDSQDISKESILQKIHKHVKANEEQIFDKLEKAMSLQGFINILEDYVGKNKLQELAIDLYQDMSQFKSKKEKSAIISKIRKEMPEYNAESIRCELEECFDLGEVKNVLAKYLGSKKVSDLSQEFFDQIEAYRAKNNIKKDEKIRAMVLKKLEVQDPDTNAELVYKSLLKCSEQVDFLQILSLQYGNRAGQALVKEVFTLMTSIKKEEQSVNKTREKLNKYIESQDVEQVYAELLKTKTVREVMSIMKGYVGEKKLKEVSEDIYYSIGMNTRKNDRMEELMERIENEGLPVAEIQKFRKTFGSGKKYLIQKQLTTVLGLYKGQKLYEEFEKDMKEVVRLPYERAKKIKVQNGLDFYEYPVDVVSEREKMSAKTLLVLGQTGCGKSTFLNALVNHLQDIDLNDFFRYQICIDDVRTSVIHSMTKTISKYYAKDVRNGAVYRIFDTPGFGDTDGIESDNKNVINIRKLFKDQIDEIHCVLFVLKCSVNKITTFQQYVFQTIMDLFGKDIAKNILFVFTFSDSGKPLVYNVIENPEKGFGKYLHLLEEPKYIEVNNCGIFQKIDPTDSIKTGYWAIGMSCISRLFEKVRALQGNSLTMTKDMLRKKEHYSLRMQETQKKLERSIVIQQNVQCQMERIISCSEEINRNSSFEIEIQVDEYYSVLSKHNVTRCQNCVNSNCHIACVFEDTKKKRSCCAMDETGNCKICEKNCHYSSHYNSKEVRKVRKVKVKQTNSELKSKYHMAENQKNMAEKILIEMFKEMDKGIIETAKYAKEILEIEEELNKICLTNKKQETTVEYLKYLITEQRKNKRKDWQEKIDIYNRIIKEYEIIEQYAKGGLEKKRDEMLYKIREARNKAIINSVDPNYWDRLKSFMP